MSSNVIETLTFAPHSVRKCREKAVDDVFLSDFNKNSFIFAYKSRYIHFSVENINGVHELF